MSLRLFLLIAVVAVCLPGCALDELLSDSDYEPSVVYVHDSPRPVYYDPYYNQPKIYLEPRREHYYETTKKKTKGNRIYKTTTVKNQYGQTVYKNTTSKKKKKK